MKKVIQFMFTISLLMAVMGCNDKKPTEIDPLTNVQRVSYYGPDSVVLAEGPMQYGSPVSKWRYFDLQGRSIRVVEYVDASSQIHKTYDQYGLLVYMEEVKNDTLVSTVHFNNSLAKKELKGKLLYKEHCAVCHKMTVELIGPPLKDAFADTTVSAFAIFNAAEHEEFPQADYFDEGYINCIVEYVTGNATIVN